MYKHILHATDLSETHFNISERAAAIAKHFKAKLFLLHVIELPTGIQIAQGLGFTELAQPSKDDASTVMHYLGEALNVPEKQQFIEVGSAEDCIIAKVKELNCQLVILGSQSPDRLSHLLGSTAKGVLQHPPCDVLTLIN